VVSVRNFIVTSTLLRNEQGIMEFQLQKWLRERAKTLHYTYIACLVLMCIYCRNKSYNSTVSNSLLLFILLQSCKRKCMKLHNTHYLQWIIIVIY